jgi:hypothetical protein
MYLSSVSDVNTSKSVEGTAASRHPAAAVAAASSDPSTGQPGAEHAASGGRRHVAAARAQGRLQSGDPRQQWQVAATPRSLNAAATASEPAADDVARAAADAAGAAAAHPQPRAAPVPPAGHFALARPAAGQSFVP